MRRGSGLARGSSQLKRTGFKAAVLPSKERPKRTPSVLFPSPSGSRAPSAMARLDGVVRSAPKSVEHRNQALLDMARGRSCLLRVPGICNHDPETTVACHSNQSVHGKGGARKADDHYSVWGCHACHTWLDQEGVAYELKVEWFGKALLLQIEQWLSIALGDSSSDRDRRAARWALFLHGVPV